MSHVMEVMNNNDLVGNRRDYITRVIPDDDAGYDSGCDKVYHELPIDDPNPLLGYELLFPQHPFTTITQQQKTSVITVSIATRRLTITKLEPFIGNSFLFPYSLFVDVYCHILSYIVCVCDSKQRF